MKFTRLSILSLVCLVFGHQLSGSTTVATPVAHPALPAHTVAVKPIVHAPVGTPSPYITASLQKKLIEKAQAARAKALAKVNKTHKIISPTGQTKSGATVITAPKTEATTVVDAEGAQLRYGDYVQLVSGAITQTASGTTEDCLTGVTDKATGTPEFVVASIIIPAPPVEPVSTPAKVQSLTSFMTAPTTPPAPATSPRSQTNFDPTWFRFCGACTLQADGTTLVAANNDGTPIKSNSIVSLRSVATGHYLSVPMTVNGTTHEVVNFVLAVVSQTTEATASTTTASKHYAQTKYTITLQASATQSAATSTAAGTSTATTAATGTSTASTSATAPAVVTLPTSYLSATGSTLIFATTPADWMIDAMKPYGSTGEDSAASLAQDMLKAEIPSAVSTTAAPTTVSKLVALGSAIPLATAPIAMAFAPNSMYAVVGNTNTIQAYLLKGSTFSAVGSATLSGVLAGANSIQISADNHIIVGTQDGNIALYTINMAGVLTKVASTPSGAAGSNYAIAIPPIGDYFVAGNYNDGQIRYYSYTVSPATTTTAAVTTISSLLGSGGSLGQPASISWSSSHNMIFTYSNSGSMWTSLVNGRTITLNPSTMAITMPSGISTIRDVAFSPNGSYLALAGTSNVGLLNCPNASSMIPAGGVFPTSGNTCIAWSPDSKYLAITTPSQLEICTAATTGLTVLTQTSGISNPIAVGWAGHIIAVANSNSLSFFQVE